MPILATKAQSNFPIVSHPKKEEEEKKPRTHQPPKQRTQRTHNSSIFRKNFLFQF
jgi:hypothetical protein